MTPPALANREGTDIRHLISEADAGAWEFALSCGSFVHFLTDDGNRAACNRAYWLQRLDDVGGECPDGLAAPGSVPFHAGENSDA